MNKETYEIYRTIEENYCFGCDAGKDACDDCSINKLLTMVDKLEEHTNNSQEGCFICKDKNGKNKEVFYDTGRGGLGVSLYCPNCGRRI